MKNLLLVYIFAFSIIFVPSNKASAQTWKELMDSSKFYQEKGDFHTSLDWVKKALPKAKEEFGELDTNYIKTIDAMSKIFLSNRNLDSASYFAENSLKLSRIYYKGDHLDLANRIDFIATLNNLMGDYRKVEQLRIESFNMKKRIYKVDHPDLAEGIIRMAYFYENIGDYSKAEQLFIEALEMYRRIFKSDHPDLAWGIIAMASFFNHRGDYSKAEPLVIEAINIERRIFKTDHEDLAWDIINLANLYYQIKNYSKAEPLYIEALEMSRRIYKSDNWILVWHITNVSYFYNAVGNYSKAESLCIEALEMSRRIYKTDHPSLAADISNGAGFYFDRGDYSKAEPLYIEALEMSRRTIIPNRQILVWHINKLANFYNEINNYSKAEPLYKESLEFYKTLLDNYFPSLSEREKKQFWGTVSDNFEGFNSFAVKRALESPNILSNMYDMQLYSKALLFNATSKVKKRILNSNDSVLIDKYKEWSDKKEFLVKLYSMQQDSLKKKGFNVDSIETLANELEKELSLKSEQFAQSYEKKKVNWKSVQTLLKPDEAAVEVVRFRYRDGKRFTDTVYYAFLIVNEQTEEHPDIVLLENGSQLENEYYNDYRAKIKSRDEDKNSFSRYWGKLYEKLKDYKKLYFSTDGIYNKLNPATLQMPDGKYLLDIQDIQQVNSTKDIILGYYQNKQESNIYNSAVLIGNPNFSMEEEKVKELSQRMRGDLEEEKVYEPLAATRGIELTKLPGTEKEINDINELLKSRKWDVKSFLGDLALKTAVKTVNNPRVLHIATHGLFLEDVKREENKLFGFDEKKLVENPLLRSGLFFTGADNYLKSDYIKPTGEENGLLTAYEAMNLDLDKTELVVLSACETGLGEIKNGEGVFGLRRAFQTAGAKTVVMSLWTVNDEATQELMSNFYSNWVTGMTKRDAFSKAQQTVKDKYKDPYYWGAFVMVGE